MQTAKTVAECIFIHKIDGNEKLIACKSELLFIDFSQYFPIFFFYLVYEALLVGYSWFVGLWGNIIAELE